MAHPKRRQSSTRQAKRRTHDKARTNKATKGKYNFLIIVTY